MKIWPMISNEFGLMKKTARRKRKKKYIFSLWPYKWKVLFFALAFCMLGLLIQNSFSWIEHRLQQTQKCTSGLQGFGLTEKTETGLAQFLDNYPQAEYVSSSGSLEQAAWIMPDFMKKSGLLYYSVSDSYKEAADHSSVENSSMDHSSVDHSRAWVSFSWAAENISAAKAGFVSVSDSENQELNSRLNLEAVHEKKLNNESEQTDSVIPICGFYEIPSAASLSGQYFPDLLIETDELPEQENRLVLFTGSPLSRDQQVFIQSESKSGNMVFLSVERENTMYSFLLSTTVHLLQILIPFFILYFGITLSFCSGKQELLRELHTQGVSIPALAGAGCSIEITLFLMLFTVVLAAGRFSACAALFFLCAGLLIFCSEHIVSIMAVWIILKKGELHSQLMKKKYEFHEHLKKESLFRRTVNSSWKSRQKKQIFLHLLFAGFSCFISSFAVTSAISDQRLTHSRLFLSQNISIYAETPSSEQKKQELADVMEWIFEGGIQEENGWLAAQTSNDPSGWQVRLISRYCQNGGITAIQTPGFNLQSPASVLADSILRLCTGCFLGAGWLGLVVWKYKLQAVKRNQLLFEVYGNYAFYYFELISWIFIVLIFLPLVLLFLKSLGFWIFVLLLTTETLLMFSTYYKTAGLF